MTKKSNGENLPAVQMQSYPALVNGTKALDVIRENLAGEDITPDDLTRIKVPAGGNIHWMVPDENGDDQPVKELKGIIVYVTRRRAYWPDPEITGDRPQCTSNDCRIGVGDPGGACQTCVHAQFGSRKRGQACKETKLLFLLREGQSLPEIVVVPPASLKPLKTWLFRLSTTGITGLSYRSVVTSLTLAKRTSKDNVEYSEIQPHKVAVLPHELQDRIIEYAQSLQEVFEGATATMEEATGETVVV